MGEGVGEWWSRAESLAANHSLGVWLFLRALGLIYAIAFLSLTVQVKGLAGPEGISPAREFLKQVKEQFGRRRFAAVPTLCWLNNSERFLRFLCWGGAVAAVLVLIGVATLPAMMVCFVFYLSLFGVARLFLGYQWDVLLLEVGFLAMFLVSPRLLPSGPAEAPAWPMLVMLYWLLFRLMFLSGVVKLASGDRTWKELTALTYHYETQPLPTPGAWFAHQLPPAWHRMSTLLMLAVELGIPFLIFAPAPYRHFAGLTIIAFMLLIMLTGNYCFFNLLTIALCLPLFDDGFYARILPWLEEGERVTSARWPNGFLVTIAIIMLGLSFVRLLRFLRVDTPLVRRVNQWLDSIPIVNHYGLFSIMTTTRLEIVIEGSRDGRTWLAYEFRWKPGNVNRELPWVAPHQPRLDWQMWFAALSDYRLNGWFIGFLIRLLQGSPVVLKLLARNPFSDAPPTYIRAVLYEYRFTDWKTRRDTGARWTREKRWLYCPVYSLRGPEKEFMPPDDF